MSNSDYSRLLSKMAELKTHLAEYKTLTEKHVPATATSATAGASYTITPNKNAISKTATPLVIRPGNDFGQHWKYVGKIEPSTLTDLVQFRDANSLQCWNLAANDKRLFKQVAYTGDTKLGSNPGQTDWNNRCYGLIYDAPDGTAFDTTDSSGYTFMIGNRNVSGKINIYTKLGITDSDDMLGIAGASKLQDIEQRVKSLVNDIVEVGEAGINNELSTLVSTATESNLLISKINNYMNTGASAIDKNYGEIDKRKNMNNVYAEINEQKTLLARKYRFIFYIIIAICIIIGFASYTSKLPIIEQISTLKNFVGFGWWTNWWVITIVVVIFILSSFGWDMKGNIMMIIRYVTDPSFWTGQMWWVGVTFVLLLIIFFHATFKSFFVEFDAGMKNVQEDLDNES
jgi:hypothetical protein